MRNLNQLNAYRLKGPEIVAIFGSDGGPDCGAFGVMSRTDHGVMFVIASVHAGWDHVSVSRADRCPNWDEMQQVHRLFFKPDECAMQLHAPAAEHVNDHPFCLHLWRPTADGVTIPRPPAALVAAQR